MMGIRIRMSDEDEEEKNRKEKCEIELFRGPGSRSKSVYRVNCRSLDRRLHAVLQQRPDLEINEINE